MVILGGSVIAFAAMRDRADARSGQSLAFAEHACLEYDVSPGTSTFEDCVARAARAFDRGEPDLAYMQALSTRDARRQCAADGKAPGSQQHVECVAAQVERTTMN